MRFYIISFALVLLLGCEKDKTSAYPDCFIDLTSTHTVLASYGSSQTYVELSDSSALLINLSDEELCIGTSCKTLNPDDLINWNTVRYLEWTLHPDSVPPNFYSDYLLINSSTIRRWDITGGSITAIVSKPADKRTDLEKYLISIQLVNGVFDRSASGLSDILIDEVTLRDVSTGGYGPG